MTILIRTKIAIDNLTAKISSLTSAVLGRVNWLYVRLAFIFLVVAPPLFAPANENQEVQKITWTAVPLAFIFGVVGLQFVIGIQAFNPMSAEKWFHPRWESNPFNLKQPLQFFHFGGWLMLAGSLPYLSAAIEGSQGSIILAAMSASFGFGILLGVKLSVLIYRRKFDRA